MENNSEVTFDDEFPRDGFIIKDIKKEMIYDINYNIKRIA